MWPWKKSNTTEPYKEIILNSFPISLRKDVEKVIAILPLPKKVFYQFRDPIGIDNLIHMNTRPVILEKEELNIPMRMYFNEPAAEQEEILTDLQKVILNCFYLRHHNGFIRQKRLALLINKTEYFIIPFTFQLLGEYVIEILETLELQINSTTVENYVKFIQENKKYTMQTESRMISYWNSYYRQRFPKLKQYIGTNIFDRLKKANAQHCIAE